MIIKRNNSVIGVVINKLPKNVRLDFMNVEIV